MDWNAIGLIWTLELRTLLRSPRTIVLSVLLPILVMPLMLFATRFSTSFQERQQASTVYRYAITGDWINPTRALVQSAALELGNDPDAELQTFRYAEATVADARSSVGSGEIDFLLETFSPESAELEWSQNIDDGARSDRGNNEIASETAIPWLEQRISGVPGVRIGFPGNRANSTAGAGQMRALLEYGRRIEVQRRLESQGFDLRMADVLAAVENNVATDAETSGLLIGRFLTLLLFILTLTGGSVVAMDIIAGEKERGTLETLLTTSAGRREIVVAKQLVILTSALVITLLQVANLFVYTRLDILELPDAFNFQLGLGAAAAILLTYLPFAALVAGALLLVSAYAKSYKEAQLYFFPVYLLGMLPAGAGAIGDIPLRSAIALIPLANVSVAVREILSGHIDWLPLSAVLATNSVAALWVVHHSTTLMGDERLISTKQEPHPDGSRGLGAFRSQLWRWYAVMWAVLFVGAASIPALSDFRMQALFNEIVILAGTSFLIIRVYRLKPWEALALRPVPALLWPVVLLLIGPLHLTAVVINRLASTVFPLPSSYLEQLDQQFSLEGVPLWQIFVLFAVLPGICEEIAFRGPLLYGLRRRFSMPVLAVVVGLIFGFFHFSLFRIVTTAAMGIAITAVALLTGSILPGMVLHLGNNALALGLAHFEFPVDQLPGPVYAIGVGSTLALLWVLYRNRTPYPEE